jgi:hypothetical protein
VVGGVHALLHESNRTMRDPGGGIKVTSTGAREPARTNRINAQLV